MTWFQYIWPWSKERREQAARAKEIEERFQAQLNEAEQRQENLKAAVDKIREGREKREEAQSQRAPSLNSTLPVPQE